MGAKQEDLQVAQQVADKIKSLLGQKLQKVILFGSRARGDSFEWSDYDFAVIAEFDDSHPAERAVEIYKHVGNIPHGADYIAVTESELENKFLFRKAVKEEGVVLYDRGH